MPKPGSNPITAADLATFVANDSDFAFEMKALVALRGLGFECSHSGTYRDPVTDKFRQFDIRAVKDTDFGTLALAAECKNIRPIFPLLLSAVPRTESEAFHEVIGYHRGQFSYATAMRIEGALSRYKPGDMVGKKTDQVGSDQQGGFFSNDEQVFDKMNQAVNSCRDLVVRFVSKTSPPIRRGVVPLLIVPEGALWQVDYSAEGALMQLPRQVEHATLFFNHGWTADLGLVGPVSYRLSHIEFVTLNALPTVIASFVGDRGYFDAAG